MARIRSIKPEFFTSEQVVECSTNARLLFVGLWCFCDDQGVHPASTKRVKMEVFPGDEFSDNQVSEWISELLKAGLIGEFAHENQAFWFVTGWKKHQKIDKPTNRYPSPPDLKFDESSSNAPRMLDEDSSTAPPRIGDESIGDESKGEKDSCTEPVKAPASVPDEAPPVNDPVVLTFPTVGTGPHEWPLRQSKITEYIEAFPGVDVPAECRKALQWLRDNPPRRKTAAGMGKFLNSWLGKAQNDGHRTNNGNSGNRGLRHGTGQLYHDSNGQPAPARF